MTRRILFLTLAALGLGINAAPASDAPSATKAKAKVACCEGQGCCCAPGACCCLPGATKAAAKSCCCTDGCGVDRDCCCQAGNCCAAESAKVVKAVAKVKSAKADSCCSSKAKSKVTAAHVAGVLSGVI